MSLTPGLMMVNPSAQTAGGWRLEHKETLLETSPDISKCQEERVVLEHPVQFQERALTSPVMKSVLSGKLGRSC